VADCVTFQVKSASIVYPIDKSVLKHIWELVERRASGLCRTTHSVERKLGCVGMIDIFVSCVSERHNGLSCTSAREMSYHSAMHSAYVLFGYFTQGLKARLLVLAQYSSS